MLSLTGQELPRRAATGESRASPLRRRKPSKLTTGEITRYREKRTHSMGENSYQNECTRGVVHFRHGLRAQIITLAKAREVEFRCGHTARFL
jgi:hypothetical protein